MDIYSGFERESLDFLRNYLRINTSYPPGNEIAAAAFFKEIFDREGIKSKIYESEPNRASIVANLQGSGEKDPVILLNHMDVVPVEPDKWNFPAFNADDDGTYIYARGAMDMKSFGILQMMAMLMLRRSGRKLKRDVYFIGCADEEQGGTKGAGFISKTLPELGKAAFCINEGGGIRRDKSGNLLYRIGFSEKIPARFKVVAEGTPGHGSVPHGDNCNVKLVEALERLNRLKTSIHIIPVVRTYLKSLSLSVREPLKSLLADIDRTVKDPEKVKILETDFPHYNALIRNTMSLNVIHSAGIKENVIPSESYAVYDARILPEQSRDEFIKMIKSVVEDLPVRVVDVDPSRPAVEKIIESENSEFYKIIEEVASSLTPGAIVTPSIMTGASDSPYFRVMGVPSYGFAPFIFDEGEEQRVHGHNERISFENFIFGLNAFNEIMEKIS